MSDYRAPLEDIRFVLNEIAGLPEIATFPGYEDASDELAQQILEEAGKLAKEVIAPLNHKGDQEGAQYENGVVRTVEGWSQAYGTYVEGGWNSLPFTQEYGGMGLPWSLAIAVQEMWNSANFAFALCPLLNQGATELLQAHGNDAQKEAYLHKMISGEWTGTMNLTEPQAGSDVGAVKTKATKVEGADHYLIKGQKIFITYGEHDMTDNIVHMVLARTPDAPAGTKGISLFLVPKFLLKEDGTPGPRNDARCVSIEHKLGIHGSPTCVMAYGDNEGAIGYLIGEENKGMSYMFTMMNNARLSVGLQGVAIAERAYQQARNFARDRVQSPAMGAKEKTGAPIIKHPDVRRNLMTMRALTEAGRAMAYVNAAALDIAHAHPDAAERDRVNRDVADLLIPITKSWCTDMGCNVASIGVQIHGGMGFIEETGAAQHFRDARIAPIYEGTNGIQALDLIGRKIMRHKGEPARALTAAIRATIGDLEAAGGPALEALADALSESLVAVEQATDWLVETFSANPVEAAAGATPYQSALGTLVGGWLLAKGALAAQGQLDRGEGNADFLKGKVITARFYADNILPQTQAAAAAAIRGSSDVLALEEELL
ncbi:acyl-CoA dehydrogenase [Rhodovibrionaceae bacterium A322]